MCILVGEIILYIPDDDDDEFSIGNRLYIALIPTPDYVFIYLHIHLRV